jgi:hypothetical protein
LEGGTYLNIGGFLLMTNDLFDFGFTALDELDIEADSESVQLLNSENSSLQKRLDGVYYAILPLLENLKKNPEKEYIHWPNRIEKINEFKTKLENLYKG